MSFDKVKFINFYGQIFWHFILEGFSKIFSCFTSLIILYFTNISLVYFKLIFYMLKLLTKVLFFFSYRYLVVPSNCWFFWKYHSFSTAFSFYLCWKPVVGMCVAFWTLIALICLSVFAVVPHFNDNHSL